ncbi:aspartic peptidase domain-containing protein [Mrakia frigida]|uniref:aspartic peptidase domain-containing protein n=1 Tax=Mrakia frigida TaxID=29902 RepID=UPI003FCBFF0C
MRKSLFFLLATLFASSALSATTTPPLPEQPSYRGDGTILDLPLRIVNSGAFSYFLPSALGTPPQSLNLTLSFGIPGLVVPDSSCISDSEFDACQQFAPGFNASASSTFVNTTSGSSSVLGGTFASGYYGNDTFTALGNSSSENYVVANQALSVATDASGLFYYDGSQGIFGLGTSSANLSSSVLGNRLNNGPLAFFTVGVDLEDPDLSQSTSSGGTLNWGGVDLEGRSSSGNLTWMAVNQSETLDPWSIPLDGMDFDGRSIQLGADGVVQMASLEPWFNAVVLPSSVTDQIFGAQGMNYSSTENYWFVPCDQLYRLSFTIGGTRFNLDPGDFATSSLPNTTMCRSTVYSWTDRSTEDIYRLGAPFLRAVYTALHVYRSEDSSNGIGQVVGLSQKAVNVTSSPRSWVRSG